MDYLLRNSRKLIEKNLFLQIYRESNVTVGKFSSTIERKTALRGKILSCNCTN